MIGPPARTQVWLAAGATDMQRGFDGLATDQQREIERQAQAIENLEQYALLGSAVIADA